MSSKEIPEEESIKEGDKLFNFEIINSEGRKYHVEDLIGKYIVVYFYPKDFTPGCTTEAEEFTTQYDLFKEQGIEIVGISPDTPKIHMQFREKINIPYYLVSDENNEISKRFGVYGLKKFMGKEYYGINRSTFLIDKSGHVIKVFKKVKPNGHGKEVLEFFNNYSSA